MSDDDGGSSTPRAPPRVLSVTVSPTPGDELERPASPSGLVLVHDSDSDDERPFFEFDDSESGSDDDTFLPPTDSFAASAVPPLPHVLIFLFMISPYLKLGALLLPHAHIPPRFGIPVLVFFAVLSAFARQIWYMLARYVGKADMESVVLDTFARGRRRETSRRRLRVAVRLFTGLSRVLLGIVYLRESADMLLPVVPTRVILPSRWVFAIVAALLVFPLSLAQSLGSRRVLVAAWLSVLTFVGWLILAGVGHKNGQFHDHVFLEGRGILFDHFSIIAFAFTTIWDIPLYASLKANGRERQLTGRRSKSYRLVSIIATAIAAVLVALAMLFTPSDPRLNDDEDGLLAEGRSPSWSWRDPSVESFDLTKAIAGLSAVSLVLFVPTLVVTCPPLPIPARLRRISTFPWSKFIVLCLIFGGSLLPSVAVTFLSDICILISLAGTYFLPALLHIVTHTFKRQLSIIVPRNTLPRSSRDEEERTPLAATDELLQRKERELQKRRKWRRVIWDVGVWVLLLPVGGGGLVWAAGRVGRFW